MVVLLLNSGAYLSIPIRRQNVALLCKPIQKNERIMRAEKEIIEKLIFSVINNIILGT